MKCPLIFIAVVTCTAVGATEVRYALGDARHYTQGPSVVDVEQRDSAHPAQAGRTIAYVVGERPTGVDLRMSTARSEIRLFRNTPVEVFTGDRNKALLSGGLVEFGPEVKIQYFRSDNGLSDQLVVYDHAGRLSWIMYLHKVD